MEQEEFLTPSLSSSSSQQKHVRSSQFTLSPSHGHVTPPPQPLTPQQQLHLKKLEEQKQHILELERQQQLQQLLKEELLREIAVSSPAQPIIHKSKVLFPFSFFTLYLIFFFFHK